jgi:ABC-2 type transport system permease protein
MFWSNLKREVVFLLRQKFMPLLFILMACLCSYAIATGIAEVKTQRATIDKLLASDSIDRAEARKMQSDYGGAGYYQFHLTYDQPSNLAFAAFGQRDVFPWKHRIRMLALEGQIYETDASNPELAFAGRLDFSFIVSVLTPLFVILLLHDLKASERAAGRYNLLVATAASDRKLWVARALVRVAFLLACMLIPFWVGSFISGVSLADQVFVSFAVVAYLAFWSLISFWFAGLKANAPTIASVLLGGWLMMAFILPAVGEKVIEALVPAPSGGDIVLLQREAVNDAWDLPKEVTMDEFVLRHPEWADHAEVGAMFDWKWYYAFQQVGDQQAEALSQEYRAAIAKRDRLAGYIAFIMPPALFERFLSHRAGTDVKAGLSYEAQVRAYHASLRNFYYPLLFEGQPYDPEKLKQLPPYIPAD